MRVRTVLAAAVVGLSSVVGLAVAPASAAGTSTITGSSYRDLNGDGVRQSSETGFDSQYIDVFASGGAYVGSTKTDANGDFSMSGLAAGSYDVYVGQSSWNAIRGTWVPTTTGTVRPARTVDATAGARVDFGWRQITWSTDVNLPISTATTSDGVRVESFNDAVTATEIASALEGRVLRGLGEASRTTVRFAYSGINSCPGSSTMTNGQYTAYAGTCYVTYGSWLDTQDAILFHEYGHSWAQYHSTVVLNDPTLSGYLDARGLTGNPKLGSSHAWEAGEILAEDYRQLFGSTTAAARPQENAEIPPAAAVAGLREYLSGPFITTPAAQPAPNAAPSVTVTSPASATTVGGPVTITAAVHDDADAATQLTVESSVDGGASRPMSFDAATGRFSASWDASAVSDGTHTITVRATDTAGSANAAAVQVVVKNVVVASIGDLDGVASTTKGGWIASVRSFVRTSSGAAVSGATVSFSWRTAKGSATGSCVTGSDGWCGISAKTDAKTSTLSFQVGGVTGTGLTYDATANSDPDGDSTGTSITVRRP